MAQISDVSKTTPITWPQSNKVHQADKQKDNRSRQRKDDEHLQRDDSDDDNHIDEYA